MKHSPILLRYVVYLSQGRRGKTDSDGIENLCHSGGVRIFTEGMSVFSPQENEVLFSRHDIEFYDDYTVSSE